MSATPVHISLSNGDLAYKHASPERETITGRRDAKRPVCVVTEAGLTTQSYHTPAWGFVVRGPAPFGGTSIHGGAPDRDTAVLRAQTFLFDQYGEFNPNYQEH